MRQSLMQTFDQIYMLDLHGSTKPKELAPEDVENENVFDIQKGVCDMRYFVKNPGVVRGIWFSEFWGTRLEKYRKSASIEQFDHGRLEESTMLLRHTSCAADGLDTWDGYKEGWSSC